MYGRQNRDRICVVRVERTLRHTQESVNKSNNRPAQNNAGYEEPVNKTKVLCFQGKQADSASINKSQDKPIMTILRDCHKKEYPKKGSSTSRSNVYRLNKAKKLLETFLPLIAEENQKSICKIQSSST